MNVICLFPTIELKKNHLKTSSKMEKKTKKNTNNEMKTLTRESVKLQKKKSKTK